MSETEMQSASHNPALAPPKRKSWLRTILWMISMMLLVNVAMAIIAYVLYLNKYL